MFGYARNPYDMALQNMGQDFVVERNGETLHAIKGILNLKTMNVKFAAQDDVLPGDFVVQQFTGQRFRVVIVSPLKMPNGQLFGKEVQLAIV